MIKCHQSFSRFLQRLSLQASSELSVHSLSPSRHMKFEMHKNKNADGNHITSLSFYFHFTVIHIWHRKPKRIKFNDIVRQSTRSAETFISIVIDMMDTKFRKLPLK